MDDWPKPFEEGSLALSFPSPKIFTLDIATSQTASLLPMRTCDDFPHRDYIINDIVRMFSSASVEAPGQALSPHSKHLLQCKQ
jgi:hypothetical protein